MKKIFLLFFALTFICFAADAQCVQYCLKSTGQNVNVRVGPGKNYRVVNGSGAYGFEGKVQLEKGQYVGTDGVKRNGFTHVYYIGWYNAWEDGWVASQYLAPTTKCRACNGRGFLNRKCPECHGEGYHYCCNYTGKAVCNVCSGVGYK